MASIRPPKKSETIEVRLPHAAKTAFMERCRHEQLTASEAIRLFIDDQLAPRPKPRQRRTAAWRVVAAGVAGTLLGMGGAAPSFAWAAQNTRPVFDRLDHNHDGVLSYQEFRSR